MQLKLLNTSGAASQVDVSDAVFGRDYNEPLIHQVVTAYRANGRSGNRMQKTRGEVKHSTRKPWKQKGTGRARAGMTSSPIWRGGGRAHPSRPDENFSHKVNRKMYRAGLCSILSQLVREDRLVVVDAFTLDTPKTKAFVGSLRALGMDESVLVITDEMTENLFLASRNLPTVLVIEARQADPLSLVRFERVLMTRPALAKVEELLK